MCLSHCSVAVQLLKSSDLGRHSLLYLKEIGHGWFGKVANTPWSLILCVKLQFVGIYTCVCVYEVLLGEVSAGLSTTQVVVKELKASASVQDQMQFLEEVQPYRLVPQRPHSSHNLHGCLKMDISEG